MAWLGFADSGKPGEALPAGKPASPSMDAKAPPPAPQGDGKDPQEGTAKDEAMDALMNLMPWVVSVLFHLGLVLVALFAAWTAVEQKIEGEEPIVPDVRLSPTPGAPLQQQITKMQRSTSSSATAVARTVTQSASTGSTSGAFSGAGKTGQMSLVGIAGGSGGGKSSPFAVGQKTGGNFAASFFGTGGNARRIVYLVDASGSLIDTLPFVILELKRSISELSEQQEFTVIFFQGTEPIEVPTPRTGLKKATKENIRRVIDWVDPAAGNIIPQGLSNPVKALQLALRYQPHLIFLLSDNITGQGEYEVDQRRLLADIESNNKGTKINTIQYLYPDPLTKVGLKATLEMIAARTGGEYKYLDARELNIE